MRLLSPVMRCCFAILTSKHPVNRRTCPCGLDRLANRASGLEQAGSDGAVYREGPKSHKGLRELASVAAEKGTESKHGKKTR